MTTATTTTPIDHSTDAGFRTWVQELATQMAALGLVQTSDTGQINTSTVTRPAINTAAGYQIWRLADSTIYFELEYGTGPSTTIPQMWLTVGKGSNGSGVITSQTSTRNTVTNNTAATSTSTNYTSYFCVTTDYFGLIWKASTPAATANLGFFAFGKSVDGTGVATTQGFGVVRHGGSTSSPLLQSVRTISTAATFAESSFFSVVPGNVTSSSVSGVFQAYETWLNLPDVQPFLYVCVTLLPEHIKGTTISVALVGSTAHTYLAVGNLASSLSGVGGMSSGTALAMLWE